MINYSFSTGIYNCKMKKLCFPFLEGTKHAATVLYAAFSEQDIIQGSGVNFQNRQRLCYKGIPNESFQEILVT